MVLTVVLSLFAGLAFRKRFRGANVAVLHRDREPDRALDRGLARHRARVPAARRRHQGAGRRHRLDLARENYTHRDGPLHLRPRRPADLDAALRAADHVRDLQPLRPPLRGGGARPRRDRRGRRFATWCCRSSRRAWSASALFGFTLSLDEVARSSQAIGDRNTLPLELEGLTTTVTTPQIYALGTVTTGVSFVVIFAALGLIQAMRR